MSRRHIPPHLLRFFRPAEVIKPKDDLSQPAMLSRALRADGWYLRSEIIWARPNPMPESVTDRPTKSHSTVFLLSKKRSYFYDADAVREAYKPSSIEREKYGHNNAYGSQFAGSPTDKRFGKRLEPGQINTLGGLPPEAPRGPDGRRVTTVKASGGSVQHRDGERWPGTGRNARSVWTIATEPTPFAHFATWPRELVRRMILAGSPKGGTVLDPFAGSGTTLLVARHQGRRSIGIELNADYCQLAAGRLAQQSLLAETAG